MHQSSSTKTAANGQIDGEYEAHVRHAGTLVLVCALYAAGTVKKHALGVSCLRSDQRRRARARRSARNYVPRGRERLEYMTSLIEHVADRFSEVRERDPSPSPKSVRMQTDAELLHWAAYSYVPGAAGTGERMRRVRASYFARLHDGAAMVARRGGGRCIRLACSRAAAGGSDYCADCRNDADVQRDHNMRRKTIDELWAAVLKGRPGSDLDET